LTEYLFQRHSDLVESLISSSETLTYEIIADGSARRNVTVPPYSWNGLVLIDLWEYAFTFNTTITPNTTTDDATRLLRHKLQDLTRAEFVLWWRYLATSAGVSDDREQLKKELLYLLCSTKCKDAAITDA